MIGPGSGNEKCLRGRSWILCGAERIIRGNSRIYEGQTGNAEQKCTEMSQKGS